MQTNGIWQPHVLSRLSLKCCFSANTKKPLERPSKLEYPRTPPPIFPRLCRYRNRCRRRHDRGDQGQRSMMWFSVLQPGFRYDRRWIYRGGSRRTLAPLRATRRTLRNVFSDSKTALRSRTTTSRQDDLIATLEWSSHAFSTGRNRFISTAKRDKLGTATFEDIEIITSAQ
jgi:hypothetical protein